MSLFCLEEAFFEIINILVGVSTGVESFLALFYSLYFNEAILICDVFGHTLFEKPI